MHGLIFYLSIYRWQNQSGILSKTVDVRVCNTTIHTCALSSTWYYFIRNSRGLVSQSETQTCVRGARLMRLPDATYRESLHPTKRGKIHFLSGCALNNTTRLTQRGLMIVGEYNQQTENQRIERGLASKSDDAARIGNESHRNDGEWVLVVLHSHEFIAMHCPQVKRRTNERREMRALLLPLGTGRGPYQQCISPHT